MPLVHGKSKKTFSKNVATEMEHGKPQKQALAIAYSVQRRKKKASGGSVESGSHDMNMAHGGKAKLGSGKRFAAVEKSAAASGAENPAAVAAAAGRKAHGEKQMEKWAKAGKRHHHAEGGSISAANEKRPMPDDLHDDEMQARQNKRMRDNGQDGWTDKPTEKQAMANDVRGKKLPIKRPRMVPSDAFSTRLYDAEGNLEESAKPGPYGEKPPREDDEMDAKKSGHPVRDMEDEHSTHRKPYAKGGMIDDMDHPSKHDMQPKDHGIQEEEREDEADLMDEEAPSEDEGDRVAMSDDEAGQDRSGPAVPDMEDEHSNDRKPYADGGEIGHSADDSEDQPHHEEEEEHHDSIAAAIMARRERLNAEIDSGAHDMDSAVRMADGGILSHDSIYSDDSDVADLSRNHDEDANEEDQLSFNALRKENYNDSNLDVDGNIDAGQHGDEEEADSENKHDMVSAIRRKMRMKRQFSQD